jgi:uncharacterized protein YcbX
VSQASLAYLSHQAGETVQFDSRRFRPNLLLRGCTPHQEDKWLGGVIQIGPEVRLHVMARDPRCTIVTLDPTTGQRTIDTLRLILRYRKLHDPAGRFHRGRVQRKASRFGVLHAAMPLSPHRGRFFKLITLANNR